MIDGRGFRKSKSTEPETQGAPGRRLPVSRSTTGIEGQVRGVCFVGDCGSEYLACLEIDSRYTNASEDEHSWRSAFAKHIQKIVLTPRGGIYVAAGDWSLLGLGSYDGAGGPDRTMMPLAQAC